MNHCTSLLFEPLKSAYIQILQTKQKVSGAVLRTAAIKLFSNCYTCQRWFLDSAIVHGFTPQESHFFGIYLHPLQFHIMALSSVNAESQECQAKRISLRPKTDNVFLFSGTAEARRSQVIHCGTRKRNSEDPNIPGPLLNSLTNDLQVGKHILKE